MTEQTASHAPRPSGQGSDSPLSRLMISLENNAQLDAGVKAVQPVVAALGASGPLKEALQGKWLGHALHPLVILGPLGAWMSASVLDAAGADEDAATLLTGVGILAVVPSVLTGLAELPGAATERKRVAVVHAGANTLGCLLETASFMARRRGNTGLGKVLALAGMGAASAGGFLGGHLAVARDMGSKDKIFR